MGSVCGVVMKVFGSLFLKVSNWISGVVFGGGRLGVGVWL